MPRVLARLLLLFCLLCLVSGCRLVSPTLHVLQSVSQPVPATPLPTSVSPDTAPNSVLQQWLAYVPNEPMYREYLAFGDVAAWYRATKMVPVTSATELKALEKPQHNLWSYGLSTQMVPPDTLGMQYILFEDMRELYGFSFFDTARFLEAGKSPTNFTVLETNVDPSQIDTALLASGYTANLVEGGTFYSIRRDSEPDMASPFRTGQLGQLNRIIQLDDTLIIGRATDIVARVSDGVQGDAPTLADDPIYRALTGALAAPTLAPLGELVGAILIGEPLAVDPLPMLDQTNAEVQAQLDAYVQAPLPPYLALGFATHRLDTESHLTLAVVFPPGVDGDAAAEILGERLATYKSVTSKRPLLEHWSFVQQASIELEGLPVALVTMHATSEGIASQRPLAWSDLVFQRDLLFLLSGTPIRP